MRLTHLHSANGLAVQSVNVTANRNNILGVKSKQSLNTEDGKIVRLSSKASTKISLPSPAAFCLPFVMDLHNVLVNQRSGLPRKASSLSLQSDVVYPKRTAGTPPFADDDDDDCC